MLSAQKTRLHGMKDSRWTIKDKLTQYKGLIKLYSRDKVIIENDNVVEETKQSMQLKALQKRISNSRNSLDNAIKGDRQTLRNTLAEHKSMQLAYQNLHPTTVIERVYQDNFDKRKQLDRLSYKMKLKSKQLIGLRLEKAELKDKIKFEDTGPIAIENEAQIVTGKVQDAILKKEAALAVSQSYAAILNIMKKDAIYFDAVLSALRIDGIEQGKCMIRTTELGQLATEYLDDRKQEFDTLEKAVKFDMKKRLLELKNVRNELNDLNNNLKLLLRRDSDVNLGRVVIPKSEEDIKLSQDIEQIERILNLLRDTTMVSNFDCIFPCLEEQKRQQTRLEELLEINKVHRDTLLKKKQHADVIFEEISHTMVETTADYQEEKKLLTEQIQEEIDKREDIRNLIISRGHILVQLRVTLQQLQQMTSPILLKEQTKLFFSKRKKPSLSSLVSTTLEYVEEDSEKVIENIKRKVGKLLTAVSDVQEPRNYEAQEAYRHFNFLTNKTVSCDADNQDDESLIEATMVDPKLLTRADLKAQSDAIVAANAKTEFDI